MRPIGALCPNRPFSPPKLGPRPTFYSPPRTLQLPDSSCTLIAVLYNPGQHAGASFMKTNGKSLLNLPIICCSLVVLALLTPDACGVMTVELGGRWPENWPEELEPLRFKASTGDFMSASHATYYYIPFDTRDEFERAWPALQAQRGVGPFNRSWAGTKAGTVEDAGPRRM